MDLCFSLNKQMMAVGTEQLEDCSSDKIRTCEP